MWVFLESIAALSGCVAAPFGGSAIVLSWNSHVVLSNSVGAFLRWSKLSSPFNVVVDVPHLFAAIPTRVGAYCNSFSLLSASPCPRPLFLCRCCHLAFFKSIACLCSSVRHHLLALYEVHHRVFGCPLLRVSAARSILLGLVETRA